MNIYAFESTVMLVVLVVLLAIKGFAFVNSLTYSAEAYEAAGKLTKPAWAAITGLGFAAQLILMGSSPLGIIHLVFTIASLVYLADVRPALAEVTSRRSLLRRSRSDRDETKIVSCRTASHRSADGRAAGAAVRRGSGPARRARPRARSRWPGSSPSTSRS